MMSGEEFYFLIQVFDHLRVDTDQVNLPPLAMDNTLLE